MLLDKKNLITFMRIEKWHFLGRNAKTRNLKNGLATLIFIQSDSPIAQNNRLDLRNPSKQVSIKYLENWSFFLNRPFRVNFRPKSQISQKLVHCIEKRIAPRFFSDFFPYKR